MGLEINASTPLGVNSNFFINPISSQQRTSPPIKIGNDSVNTSSDLSKYISEKTLAEAIATNPNIAKLLAESKTPVRLNMNALEELSQGHLKETRNAALGIYNNLPEEYKNNVNVKSVMQAAILHDVGKSLIPEKILNKNSKFSPEERNIMEKHSELSYELLKSANLDNKTLELIKNHHQNAQLTGYPKADEIFVSDINTQILNAADMYSALREARPYKDAMSKNHALAIIHHDVKNGKIHPKVFKALVDFANREECKQQPANAFADKRATNPAAAERSIAADKRSAAADKRAIAAASAAERSANPASADNFAYQDRMSA